LKANKDLEKKVETLQLQNSDLEEVNDDLQKKLDTLQESKYKEQNAVSSGCGDWLKSCENNCVQTSTTPIPKHVHFVSLNHPFSFVESRESQTRSLSILTDYKTDVLSHTLTTKSFTHCLGLTFWIVFPSNFYHINIFFVSPSSITVEGYSYMDTDILSLNSFDSLLKHQMVLAEQCNYALNVALMMAQKHSCLVCRFARYSCGRFNGGWVDHSVNALSSFARGLDKEKEGVMVVPWKKGFLPMCWDANGIKQLYKKN
jgi:hypothetical protein